MIKIGEKIRTLELLTLFRWFIIYSVIGWIYETLYTYMVSGRFTNRGFLFGPLCPIYGLSILLMILISSDRSKTTVNLIVRCALVATAMEYVTSFWLEYFFNKRWWDYSDMFMNVNGRICIGASLLFGILGAFFIRIIHPIIKEINNRLPNNIIRIIDATILVIFLYDILLSLRTNLVEY